MFFRWLGSVKKTKIKKMIKKKLLPLIVTRVTIQLCLSLPDCQINQRQGVRLLCNNSKSKPLNSWLHVNFYDSVYKGFTYSL